MQFSLTTSRETIQKLRPTYPNPFSLQHVCKQCAFKWKENISVHAGKDYAKNTFPATAAPHFSCNVFQALLYPFTHLGHP